MAAAPLRATPAHRSKGNDIRTWGRQKLSDGTLGPWIEITDTSLVWVATLVQTLRLAENESPFYGNFGIPAQSAVNTQTAPDAAIARTQSQYSSRFASLSIVADQTADEPTYDVTVVLTDGTLLEETVAT